MAVDTGAARMDVLIEMVSSWISGLADIEQVRVEAVFLLELRRGLWLVPGVHGGSAR